MNADDLVLVYESAEAGLVEIVAVALEAEGIECSVEHGGYVGMLPYRLFVRAEDEARAREFIAEHERKRDESQD